MKFRRKPKPIVPVCSTPPQIEGPPYLGATLTAVPGVWNV